MLGGLAPQVCFSFSPHPVLCFRSCSYVAGRGLRVYVLERACIYMPMAHVHEPCMTFAGRGLRMHMYTFTCPCA